MPVALGPRQQILDLLDKRLPALRVGPAEQLAGILPRQFQAMQGGADRLAAADSTGLKVYGAGEWHHDKHGVHGPRTWRKLQVSIADRDRKA